MSGGRVVSFGSWRRVISICSEAGFVYEHELAHAWEAATLNEKLRAEIMALRGYTVWSDHTVPSNEQGVEDAVFIIQQGLGGLPLRPNLFDEQCSRLVVFGLIAGFPDQRLAGRWAAYGSVERAHAPSGVWSQ